jgi:hypothetical protein
MYKFIWIGFIATLAVSSTGIKVCAEPPPAEPVLSSKTITTDVEIVTDLTQLAMPESQHQNKRIGAKACIADCD